MSPLDSEKPRPLVLLADEDSSVLSTARQMLEREGYDVLLATDGEQALASYEQHMPALVILTAAMPTLDGLSVCHRMRECHPDHPAPILIVTESEDRDATLEAYDAGATDFVAKPIDWTVLARRTRFLMRTGGAAMRLRRSERSLSRAQQIAHIGSWEWSPTTGEMHWSEEVFRILGHEPGALLPSREEFLNCVHPEDREHLGKRSSEALEVSKSYNLEHRVMLPDGRERYVHHQGEVVKGASGNSTLLVGTIQDVTEQRAAQERVRYLASFDSLTGLANRHLFLERLARATAAASAKDHLAALLYLDLDQFKRINDTLGHGAGDKLLRCVARILEDNVRGSDVVGRLEQLEDPQVSRLGGDEFTILLGRIASAEDAGDVARRVLAALPDPLLIDGHEVSPTGSIGIAIYPLDGEDVVTLLKNADTAMYHAKDLGRNNFQFYNESMNEASLRRLTMEAALRRAVEEKSFELAYQPRLDLATGAVTGTEALLRWEHPELGKVAPKEIIPLAEETGLIVPLGTWVLETACAQSRAWQDQGYAPVLLSVNVSSRQFVTNDLSDTVGRVLRETGLDPRNLEIEITESVLLQDDERTAVILRDIRAMGVRVALDDFGTGYSSLSYMTRFPLDTLKIDRCFVRDIDTDPSAAGIVKAVISMAHTIGARVVAEGVDAAEQASLLKQARCDEMQGFLFSGAVPGDDFVRFLVRDDEPAPR